MQFTLVFTFSISFIYSIILCDEGLVQFTLVFTFSISFTYFIILCDEELVQFTLVFTFFISFICFIILYDEELVQFTLVEGGNGVFAQGAKVARTASAVQVLIPKLVCLSAPPKMSQMTIPKTD